MVRCPLQTIMERPGWDQLWPVSGWHVCRCCSVRYFLLLVYVLYTLLTGCIFFGWANLASMLLKSEHFSSLCPLDENGKFVDDLRKKGFQQICEEQEAAVQHLYSITLCMTAFSVFAGTMIDSVGPRRTALLGQSMNLMASLCLAGSALGGDRMLYIGFILLGAGADTAFFPTLCASRLFPSRPGLIITLLGSASSVSFAVPPVLEAVADILQLRNPMNVFWGYAVVGPGFCLLLAFLFIPDSGFLPSNEERLEQQELDHHKRQNEVQLLESDSAASSHVCRQELEIACEALIVEEHQRWVGSAASSFCSMEFVILLIYHVVISSAVVFYEQAPNRFFDANVTRTLEALLPLSFVPCVVLGWLVDRWGILVIMSIVSCSGLLAYAFTLGPYLWMKYASVLCYIIFVSLYTSQIFIYVETRFPSRHFGKLVGVLQLVASSLVLLCNPLYSAVVVSRTISLEYVAKCFSVAMFVQLFWILCLWRMGKRSPAGCGGLLPRASV